MKLKIHTDGGSRGNPGQAACAFVVYDETDSALFVGGEYLGIKTNNEAEYYGVVEALTWVIANLKDEWKEIDFVLDSELVVKQLVGQYKIKEPRLRDLIATIKQLEKQLVGFNVSYRNVRREQNKEADLEVNRILDQISRTK
jgi:ribonuclease HI